MIRQALRILPLLFLFLVAAVPATARTATVPAAPVAITAQDGAEDPAAAEEPAQDLVASPEEAVENLTGLADKAQTWLEENGVRLAIQTAIVLVIVLAFWILGGFVGRLTDRGLQKSKLKSSKLLCNFIVSIVRKAVLLLGLLVAASTIGFEIGPLLAGLGVAGFVLGFALQDTLSNFAAGLMVMIYRPFDIGDFVSAGGVTGSVRDMTLVSTTISTPDNQVMIVPNSSIWGGVITNVTAQDTRRVDLTFGIGYEDDIDKTEKVLAQIVGDHAKVLKDPAPVIKLHELGDSSVNFVVRPWVKTSDYWEVYWDLTREVKKRFDAEGISIPFPQRDVHLYQQSN